MSFIFTHMTFQCHSYILIFHPYLSRMYSHVIRMSLVRTRMASVCHSYVIRMSLVFTRMYSYVILCTHMSPVCHSYVVTYNPCVLVCRPYVIRLWFYYESFVRKSSLCVTRKKFLRKIVSYWYKDACAVSAGFT